jgi:inner membrane protein
MPALGFLLILADDALDTSRHWPVPLQALLDEPAHLLTACLVLAAAAAPRRLATIAAALVATVAIDVDHLLIYSGIGTFGAAGRPPGHSVLLVALITAAVAIAGNPAIGAAVGAGLCVHLFRDTFTGPGVPFGWPFADDAVRGPYVAYAAVLAACAAVATVRLTLRRRPRR